MSGLRPNEEPKEKWGRNLLGLFALPRQRKWNAQQRKKLNQDISHPPKRPIDLRYGTWLDEDIHLIGKAGEKLLQSVLSQLQAFEQAELQAKPGRRRRTRSFSQQRNFERRVDCLLANAIRAQHNRVHNRVSYGRGSNSYAGKEPWLSGPMMGKCVDLLSDVGLVEARRGEWEGRPGAWDGFASTYWPTASLRELQAACGADENAFGKRRPETDSSLIRLRGEDGSDKDLKYEPTEETRQWAYDLDFFNQFSECFDIDICFASEREEEKLVNWCNGKRSETSREPEVTKLETFNRYLKRIFNDGRFDHGGRLYGAWWQYVPGWLRKRITIDGEETVELDYSCMSLRMLHHLHGSDYRDDAYDLPELSSFAAKKFGDSRYYREQVKSIVQAILNNEDETIRPEMINLVKPFPPRFTRARIKEMILEKHERIGDAFDTNVGKRLQRMDSDIALDIIVSLMDQDILALPIHDSFLVQKEHEQALREQMIKSYRKWFPFDPIIKPEAAKFTSDC